jgi:hypothetical protein
MKSPYIITAPVCPDQRTASLDSIAQHVCILTQGGSRQSRHRSSSWASHRKRDPIVASHLLPSALVNHLRASSRFPSLTFSYQYVLSSRQCWHVSDLEEDKDKDGQVSDQEPS